MPSAIVFLRPLGLRLFRMGLFNIFKKEENKNVVKIQECIAAIREAHDGGNPKAMYVQGHKKCFASFSMIHPNDKNIIYTFSFIKENKEYSSRISYSHKKDKQDIIIGVYDQRGMNWYQNDIIGEGAKNLLNNFEMAVAYKSDEIERRRNKKIN